jgi:hypothetical protein
MSLAELLQLHDKSSGPGRLLLLVRLAAHERLAAGAGSSWSGIKTVLTSFFGCIHSAHGEAQKTIRRRGIREAANHKSGTNTNAGF